MVTRFARMRRKLRYMALSVCVLISWLVIEDILDIRVEITSILTHKRQPPIDIVYEECTKIPPPPKTLDTWPEEAYIHDPNISDIREMADPARSRVWIDGKPEVVVGDTVRINVELVDGFGKRRTKGGDLVRVWMREPELGASATANMTDNQDGSYTAILTAFWEGKPTIKVAIISPREVIATQFRRRYICPPVLMNTAIFKHPSDRHKVEETPCSYDPQIPGYSDICNFTSVNFGSPWYCGKPRIPGLLCHDWSEIGDRNLIEAGYDDVLSSRIEKEITALKYKSRLIPTNISLTVTKDEANLTQLQSYTKCNTAGTTLTWNDPIPTGYLYNRKWISRHCSSQLGNAGFQSCLKNTRVFLVGDSTVRQLFDGLMKRLPCDWLTGAGMISDKSLKHRPAICVNKELNYTLEMEEHTLPFCTKHTPRTYLKTFEAHLDQIRGEERTFVVLHGFAHFLNYHSHVFYETLQNMKRGIESLLSRKSNVFIVIKGPQTMAFAKNAASVMWMPERYADIYQQFIYDTFRDLRDRVMFLECQDITISTEQWHIHAEDYIVNALIDNVFSHACQY